MKREPGELVCRRDKKRTVTAVREGPASQRGVPSRFLRSPALDRLSRHRSLVTGRAVLEDSFFFARKFN